jgi:CBS domain-containing protein
MKVSKIMTADPKTCESSTTVADAARLMWDGDCGILPVVDDGRLAGVVTDRDLFIALATRNARASALTVGEVCSRDVCTCAPEDTVASALDAMKAHQVRRLPVVGFGGRLLGILSMNDVVLATGGKGQVHTEEVVSAYQAICAHRHPAPAVAAA